MKTYTERYWIMFVSGIIWIPYCLIMLYTFVEQYKLRRYPQYLIILCLFVSCCFRCGWFFNYENDELMGAVLVSRIAILLQFSSLTLLLLMWSGVVRVSRSVSNVEGLANSNKLVAPPTVEQPNVRSDSTNENETGTEMSGLHKFYLYFTISVNIVVWAFILGTIGFSERFGDRYYNLNIALLAGLCFFEAVLIMVVGVRTGLKINRELSPVFVSYHQSGPDHQQKMKIQKSWPRQCCEFCGEVLAVFGGDFASTNHGHRLQAQAEAIQRLLLVSSIIAVFFLLRSFGFLYRQYIAP